MTKVDINVKVKAKTEETGNYIGELNNNVLTYVEKSKTKVMVDLENDTITRDDIEKNLVLDYRNKIVNLYMKEFKLSFDMDMEVYEIEKNDNEYRVEYRLENDDFSFELIYKEI